MRTLLPVLLLLCAPAWGQITSETHITLSDAGSSCTTCTWTTAIAAPASTNRVGILQLHSDNTTPGNITGCTVGGNAMTAGPNIAQGSVQAQDFYILDANFPSGAGPHTLICTQTTGDRLIGNWVQINGATQAAPEDTDSIAEAASVNAGSLTLTVSQGAFFAFNLALSVNRQSTAVATSPAAMMSNHNNTAGTVKTQSTAKNENLAAGNRTTEITWGGTAVGYAATAMAFVPVSGWRPLLW